MVGGNFFLSGSIWQYLEKVLMVTKCVRVGEAGGGVLLVSNG
jgi:hypothetical protein